MFLILLNVIIYFIIDLIIFIRIEESINMSQDYQTVVDKCQELIGF